MADAGTKSLDEVLLRLFVTGTSHRSLRAIEAVEGMCNEFLNDSVRLEIVDVLQRPDEAETEKILATPTLIRQLPGPPRRVVGDLGEPLRIIQLLGLQDRVHHGDAS
jgi:circadian clock protein KaiB